MKLHVHELLTTLEQSVKASSIQNVVAIRPHLYRKGSFDVSEKVWVTLSVGETVIATSEELSPNLFGEGENYFHGLIKFDIATQLAPNTTYKIQLHSNFTFSESRFVGWCTDFDFHTNQADYDYSTSLLQAPFRYEIWVKKHR